MREFEKMMSWSKGEFKSLPWRTKRSLYTTLVSEIMLQQTTVTTVLSHFDRFLKLYPSIDKLALATEEEIQVAWKGLGYYRRARNLLKAAKFVVSNHAGEIPLDYNKLIEIPGIGDYTASALIAIGANKKSLAIDANIERVLNRFWNLGNDELKQPKKIIQTKLAFNNTEVILLKGFRRYRQFNEALMDVGRVYCQARKAHCSICPLNKDCAAFKAGRVEELIAKKAKKVSKYYDLDLLRFIVFNKNNQVLVVKKEKGQWLEGQLELPTFILSSEDKNLNQYPKNRVKLKANELREMKSSITKYKIKNKYGVHTQKDLLENINKKKVTNPYLWVDCLDERIAHTSSKILKAVRK